MSRWPILIGLAAVIALGGIAAWVAIRSDAPTERAAPIRADAGDPALVALGSKVYTEHCAACHGAQLEGQPDWQRRQPDGKLPAPPHDASGHTWHHPDQELFELTKHGVAPFAPPDYKSDMPGFGDVLTDREIIAVIAYIKSTWPSGIRARQERLNEERSR